MPSKLITVVKCSDLNAETRRELVRILQEESEDDRQVLKLLNMEDLAQDDAIYVVLSHDEQVDRDADLEDYLSWWCRLCIERPEAAFIEVKRKIL